MISNPIAVVFSDIHHHDWKTHNQDNCRTKSGFKAMMEIGAVAYHLKVPLLFGGDMFHGFGKISLSLKMAFTECMNDWVSSCYPKIMGVSGNHDQEGATYGEDQASLSSWEWAGKTYEACFNIDFTCWATEKFKVWGIPYLTYNKSLNHYVKQMGKEARATDKRKILIIHTDLHGATEATGREVGTVEEVPEDMDSYFKDFDLVISGHIHTPQKLGKKILIPGSPTQQKKSDIGSEYGYWIIFDNGDRLIKKFIPLYNYPKFVQLKPGEEIPNGKDYYLSAEEETKEEEVVELGFSSTTSKEKLVKRYMKQIGEDSIAKRKALIRTLDESEEG